MKLVRRGWVGRGKVCLVCFGVGVGGYFDWLMLLFVKVVELFLVNIICIRKLC